MGIVSFVLFGLVAGLVARMVTPGRHAIGCLATVAVGMVGALLGGLIGDFALGHKVRFGWHLGPFLLAVAGAVVLLLALEALAGRRRFAHPGSRGSPGSHVHGGDARGVYVPSLTPTHPGNRLQSGTE